MRSPPVVALALAVIATSLGCSGERGPAEKAVSPPMAARGDLPGELLSNGGFEQGEPTDFSPWEGVAHASGGHYSTLKGSEFARSGQYGAELRQISDEAWGAFSQFLAVVELPADASYRFGAALRGTDVEDAVTLNVSVVVAGREPAYFERRIEGHEFGEQWIERSIDVLLPAGRSQVEVAITLHGAGAVWIDDATLHPPEAAHR
jgi:hypothetical protein